MATSLHAQHECCSQAYAQGTVTYPHAVIESRALTLSHDAIGLSDYKRSLCHSYDAADDASPSQMPRVPSLFADAIFLDRHSVPSHHQIDQYNHTT